MTVSFRIAGKLVHVSNIPPRAAQSDVASSALLQRVRLDPASVHTLRGMLVAEMGAAVWRLSDPLVMEQAVKRIDSGRWSLTVVDAPQLRVVAPPPGAAGSAPDQAGGSGGKGASAPKKTWVEVELLDRNRQPVKGLGVELTLPGGTVEKGTLNEKGTFRKEGIDPGTCRVGFPELDGREWSRTDSFAEGAAVTLFKRAPRIPAGPYTVVQGDHIASIAADAGFLSWKTIWEDAANAALAATRNPNVLFPGDSLQIPKKQSKEVSIPAGEYSTFQTVGDPLQLKIVVLDWAGNPVVDTELDIQLDGGEKIRTAGDGSATKKGLHPQSERVGTLTVQGLPMSLKLGHLDPVEELSGQVWRLNNLGYRAGTPSTSTAPEFLSAVEEFQCDYGLKVDGICGPLTQAKLKDVHGS